MPQIKTGNFTHDANCAAAEMTCQVAVAAAGNNQAAVTAAEIAFYCVMLLRLEFNHFCEVIGRASAIVTLVSMALLILAATAVDALR